MKQIEKEESKVEKEERSIEHRKNVEKLQRHMSSYKVHLIRDLLKK